MLFSPEEWGRELPAHDRRVTHMRKVLRSASGDNVRVGLLGVGAGEATVHSIERDGAVLDFPLRDSLEASRPLHPVRVLVAHPRPIVLKRMLKDLSTLGVQAIHVCGSDLGEKSYLRSKLWNDSVYATRPADSADSADSAGGPRERLIEGAEQAGSVFIPTVSLHNSMDAALEEVPELSSGLRLVASPHAQQDVTAYLNTQAPDDWSEGASIVIGAERGLSEREEALLMHAGYEPVGLGPRILRTETAALLACGVLSLSAIG